ncbi:MAG: M20/M25/M40 family metallo-hydrolase, partial [Pyrinomonadaceae bacterium]
VSVDAAGNIIGRRAGKESGLKPLLFGSHVDTVPEGGNYDGVVGSLGAIEVAQTLAEENVATRHPLELIIFQNEEGGLIGSRAIRWRTDGARIGSRQSQRQDNPRRHQVHRRRSHSDSQRPAPAW